jgi:hypothetical protein
MDFVSRLSLAALMLALLFAPGAPTAAMLSCDGCDDRTYRQKALAAGVGDHYVVDVRNGRIRRFLVSLPAAGEPWRATPATVDPWIQEQFETLEAALRMNGYATSLRVDLRVGAPFLPDGFGDGNAYDVAHSGTTRTLLGLALEARFAASGAMLGDAVEAFWNAMRGGASTVLGRDLAILVVVHWRDGSQSAFSLDTDNVQVAALVPGGSIDNEGNLVPGPGATTSEENAERYVGSWDFNDRNNLDRWLRNAALFGISVGRDGSAGSRLTCGVACEGAEGACRTTCVRP